MFPAAVFTVADRKTEGRSVSLSNAVKGFPDEVQP